jgi:hypothetical protein
MPKIQARAIKKITGRQRGIKSLMDCFSAKLALDGFKYIVTKGETASLYSIAVKKCPWYDALLKSGRQHIAEKIGSVICTTEFPVWATEFGVDAEFTLESRICSGGKGCVLRFEVGKRRKK